MNVNAVVGRNKKSGKGRERVLVLVCVSMCVRLVFIFLVGAVGLCGARLCGACVVAPA